MAWRVEFERSAERELDSLDTAAARRILRFLHERIAPLDDPRAIGEALRGSRFGHLWRYRIGDYRVVAAIEDEVLRIVVVRIAHRREVYR